MDNPKIEEKKDKDFYLIHFIETHAEKRKFSVFSKTKDIKTECEFLIENKYKYFDASYVSRVYRFKVPISKHIESTIQLLENENNIFEKKITNK